MNDRKPTRCLIVLLCLISWSTIWAHEGHAPLPTKGIEVDPAKGTLLLTKPAREALGLQTIEVTQQRFQQHWLAYAKLEAPWQQSAQVASQVSGKISRIFRQPGQWIEAGEPLAEIESSELEVLQADLVQASLATQLSQKLLDHYQSLSGASITTGQLQQTQSDHLTNLNRQAIARWKLIGLGFDPERLEALTAGQASSLQPTLTLTSPISGRVHHNDLTVGKVIAPGEHLFEVDHLSQVWCRIDVLEHDLPQLQAGYTVEIQLNALPGQIFSTPLLLVDGLIQTDQQLGVAWADLTNLDPQNPELLPGMFGQATIRAASDQELLTVPAAAVARDGAERFVLVQQEATAKASQFIKRNITVVRETTTTIQFRSTDVFPGDLVVTVGAQQLFNFFVQSVLQLSPEARANIALRVEPVKPQIIEQTITTVGRVELPPEQRALASIQLNGTLQSINCNRGQTVQTGEILGQIASLEFLDLQLQFLHWKLLVENWQMTKERLQSAADKNSIAQRQLWETENQFQQAQRQFDSLQRKLQSLGLTPEEITNLIKDRQPLATLPLRAPISGRLVRLNKRLGQSIQAGEVIFEIHDARSPLVRAFVVEHETNQVHVDQSARLRMVSSPNQIHQSHVLRLGQTIQADNRTRSIWLQPHLSSPSTWLHDMLAQVDIVIGKSDPVCAVPRTAVVSEGSRHYVFVQLPDQRFERRIVELGAVDDQHAEVKSGVAIDDLVAVWGATELQSAYNSLR